MDVYHEKRSFTYISLSFPLLLYALGGLITQMLSTAVGAKPLSETMLEYCYLDPQEQSSVNFNMNWNIFIQENTFENVVGKMMTISL